MSTCPPRRLPVPGGVLGILTSLVGLHPRPCSWRADTRLGAQIRVGVQLGLWGLERCRRGHGGSSWRRSSRWDPETEARPKEGAGGLTVTQVPRPRVRWTGYLHPGEGEWGGLGEDGAPLGNGDGSYLGAGL